MKHDYKVVSFRLSLSDVRRIPGNRSEFVRHAVAEKLGRESSPAWRPKTAIGRKLLKLRNQFLAQGGELLDADGIADELRQRRGGWCESVSDKPQADGTTRQLTMSPDYGLNTAPMKRIVPACSSWMKNRKGRSTMI